jgi:hypothetical protein
VAGEVAFEAADGFAACFAFAGSAVEVGNRGGVAVAADHDDRVERTVELAVAAAVEPVADRLAGGGGDGCGAGESGEGGFGSDAAWV